MSWLSKVAPQYALKREIARVRLDQIKNYSNSGASTSANWAKGMRASSESPKDDISENLDTLRGRSRHALMGNPLASGAMKKMRTNIVGSGLRLNPKPNANLLKLSPEKAAEWSEIVQREFAIWSKSKDCDRSRRLTFGQMQGLAFLSALTNGDVFAALPYDTRPGQPYDLRVQLIEADRVRSPFGNNKIEAGIELNSDGESVAAYVFDDYEGDKHIRVPFYGDNGTPILLHLAQDWERVGQVRGVPVLAPIMEVLTQLDRYTKAELMANVVSSMLTVFITSETSVGSLGDGIPLQDQIEPGNDDVIELGSGSVVGLAPGEKVHEVNPARQNSSFDSVMTAFIRQLGVALEMPYEVLISHFQSSFSASRGALQEAWKMYMMRREWLVESFVQPIYEQWLSEAVAKGRVDAHGFFDDPAVKAAWCNAKWIGPAPSSLNPVQEVNASVLKINNGLSTHEQESQTLNGSTFDEIHNTLVREYNMRRQAGLAKGVENDSSE